MRAQFGQGSQNIFYIADFADAADIDLNVKRFFQRCDNINDIEGIQLEIADQIGLYVLTPG